MCIRDSPAKVQDHGLRGTADQCIIQLDAQALRCIVVDLACKIGVKHFARRPLGTFRLYG